MNANDPSRPQRIQLSRRKGWSLPENTISVARPTRWGNPYRVGIDGTAAECVAKFSRDLIPYRHRGPCVHGSKLADFMLSEVTVEMIREGLRGKNLACWCAIGSPCHADVLLEIANDGPEP